MNPRRVLVPGFKPVVNHKGAESAVEEIVMSTIMSLDTLVEMRAKDSNVNYSDLTNDQIKDLLAESYGDEAKAKSFFNRVEEQLGRVKPADRAAMRRSRYISRLNMQLDTIIESQQTPIELPENLEDAIEALKTMDVATLRRVIKGYPELGLNLELMTPEDAVNQLIVHLADQYESEVAATTEATVTGAVEADEEIVATADANQTVEDENFDFAEGESLVTTVEDDESEEDPELDSEADDSDEDEDEADSDEDEAGDEADDIYNDDVADLVQSAGSADDLIEIMSNFSDIAPEVTDENFVIYQSSLVRSIENAAYVGQSFFDGVISGLNLALSGPVCESAEFVQSKPVSMSAKARLVVVASLADVHELHENRRQLWDMPLAADGFAPESLNFYHSVRGLNQDARPSHKRYGALSTGLRAAFEELKRFNNRDLLIAGPISTIPETLEVVGSNLADNVADLFIEGLFGVEELPLGMTLADFVQVTSQTDLDDDGNVFFTVFTALRTPMMFAESSRTNLYKALLSLSDDHSVDVTLIIAGNSRDAMFNRNLIDGDDSYDLSKAYGDGADYSSETFTLSELEHLSSVVHDSGAEDEDDFDEFEDQDEVESDLDYEDGEDEEELFSFDTTILPIETESIAPWGEDVFAVIAVQHPELDADEDDEDQVE